MPFFGFDRVMACSRADLARWLTELTGSDHGMAAGKQALIRFDWGQLAIETEEQPVQRFGLVRMQRLQVRFVPTPDDPDTRDAARAWITGFDRYTQRGGG